MSHIRIDLPFVGRQHALEWLCEQLDLAGGGKTRLVLVSAPAGTGKTALVRRFLDAVADRCVQGSGRGWDNSAAVSYHPLRDALRSLLAPRADLDDEVSAFLEDAGRAADIPPPERLFPALASCLGERARETPLCVFLDDLQWADEGTFDWLDYAFWQLEGSPILWIGAYRSEETRSLETLLARRHRWYPTGRFGEHALKPLSQSEVEGLVRQLVPEERRPEELPARIWERSQGLPLLALEEIRAWQEGRQDTPQGQALIAYRLNRLAEEDRQALEVAAVVGERFAVGPLAVALEQGEVEVGRRLERLRREQGLLEEEGSGYRFAHSRFREALLDGLSQAMQQIYHTRLARQEDELPPAQRTYHLVHSGDARQGVAALLAEGDRTRILMDWKDALRYYVEALWLVQREASREARLCLEIYLRLGDVQLLAARQPVVARSYYEAARVWAHTPREQALLLCRLAETCRGQSPESRRYLEEVAQHLVGLDDPPLRSWVEFRRLVFTPGLGKAEWRRIGQLSRQVGEIPDLPREMLAYAEDAALEAARATGEQREFEALRARLEVLPPDSWQAARCHSVLASAYFRQEGDIQSVLHHAREARRIAASLGRTVEVMGGYSQELSILMEAGQYREVRALFQEYFPNLEPGNILEMLYSYLCRSWFYDRSEEGVEWAIRYLRGVEAFFVQFPTDRGHLRKLLGMLGEVEYIFRAAAREGEFRQRVEALREKLRQAGYRTEGVWFRQEPVELDEIGPTSLEDGWVWTSEDNHARIHQDGEILCFHRSRMDGLSLLDTPRLARPLPGEFRLQMTVQGGTAVLESALQGQRLSRAVGGGGFLVLLDPQNWLRLSVHGNFLGQVQFSACQEGWRQTLGRGLCGDGPVRLRLERRGTGFYAYAGDEGGAWYSCGQIELPQWGQVDASIYGESEAPLQPRKVEGFEFRCWGVGLERSLPQPVFSETPDELYSLPTPVTDSELPEVVAASQAMQRILQQARQSRDSTLPVLIEGETGTGKELIARAVYRLSSRTAGPFVPLNCGVVAPSLLESELFGHVRGAYTGANDAHGGLIEVANQGFLFLDEIGEASLPFQVRLLRVIEEQAVRRVGDQALRPIDVRFIAATNRDLRQAISEGSFREDLYYRLKGVEIRVPPLRQRREDIPHLVAFFLAAWSRRRGRSCGITKRAMEALLDHAWPGNVRELFRVVESAAETTDEGVISPAWLSLAAPRPMARPVSSQGDSSRVAAALHASGGNISAAARRLGVSRTTMYRKMRRLGLK